MSRHGRHASNKADLGKAPLVLAAAFLAVTGVMLVQAHNVLAITPKLSAEGTLDTTAPIDTTNAKHTVTQYLAVRGAHNASVASRSRAIAQAAAVLAQVQASAKTTAVVDGSKIVSTADNYAGVRYVYGGTTPKGFDCSGYTQYVFRQFGITLPRVAQSQYNWAKKVSAKQAQVGDLVFFHSGSGVYHVGIYAGNGMLWHAPYPGKSVEKKKIWTSNVTYGTVPKNLMTASQAKQVAAARAALTAAQNMKVVPLSLDKKTVK